MFHSRVFGDRHSGSPGVVNGSVYNKRKGTPEIGLILAGYYYLFMFSNLQ
jgi:hypothetical protein